MVTKPFNFRFSWGISWGSPKSVTVRKNLQTYIKERKARDSEFTDGYEAGYQDFKIGAMLKAARKEAGMTQEQVAEKVLLSVGQLIE
ncbi:MAG: helix-turn-helix transcriptional regulator [Candidatus Electrothrix sp. Rat3]|nr:helix-turn-helix transcriptional regulator [Candidatus Electrothrix rattekaaiensis]